MWPQNLYDRKAYTAGDVWAKEAERRILYSDVAIDADCSHMRSGCTR